MPHTDRASGGAALAAVMWVGCACPTFEDIAVTDPEGLAEAEQLETYEQAIDQLAGWVRMEGVCTDEVRVTDDLDPGLSRTDGDLSAGVYRGERAILVHAERAGAGTVRHELCHGVDHMLGWASVEEEETFRPYADALMRESYSEMGQLLEAFAEACQAGPRDQDLLQALEEACGEPVIYEAFDYMEAEVFEPGGGDRGWTYGLALHQRTQLDLSAAFAGEFVVDLAGDGEHLVATTVRRGETSASLGKGPFSLVHVDPEDGAVLARRALPAGHAWYLVGGSSGRVLVGSDRAPVGFLAGVEGELEQVGLPGRLVSYPAGFVGEDEIWIARVVTEETGLETVSWSADRGWRVEALGGLGPGVRSLEVSRHGALVIPAVLDPGNRWRSDSTALVELDEAGAEGEVVDFVDAPAELFGTSRGLPLGWAGPGAAGLVRVDVPARHVEIVATRCPSDPSPWQVGSMDSAIDLGEAGLLVAAPGYSHGSPVILQRLVPMD